MRSQGVPATFIIQMGAALGKAADSVMGRYPQALLGTGHQPKARYEFWPPATVLGSSFHRFLCVKRRHICSARAGHYLGRLRAHVPRFLFLVSEVQNAFLLRSSPATAACESMPLAWYLFGRMRLLSPLCRCRVEAMVTQVIRAESRVLFSVMSSIRVEAEGGK